MASPPAQYNMSKEAKEEIRRINRKSAALERTNTELRIKNAEMKRHIASLQTKVSRFDKRVEKVLERVMKEVRSLQNSEEPEYEGAAGKNFPKKNKYGKSSVEELPGASTEHAIEAMDANDRDKGLDSIIAAFNSSTNKSPSDCRKDIGKESSPEGDVKHEQAPFNIRNSSPESRQRLLNMVKSFLDSK